MSSDLTPETIAHLRELAEARAVIEQIESLAKIQAISCQAAHRADHARNWLDVLAIIERAALAPATQREEGEPKVRVDSHGSWLPERVGGEE